MTSQPIRCADDGATATPEADSTVVVVGGGHAGGELCTSLREQGWLGRIVLVSDEPHLPYHRPPLSKTFLVDDAAPQALLLKPAAAYAKAQVECLNRTGVVRIDRAAKTLALSDGRQLRYEKLALATGGRPRPLPASMTGGANRIDNLHYLRTAEDGLRLRSQLRPGARLVIIGGGYIGLEVAASAIAHGLAVVVLEAAHRILARVTSPEMSAFYDRAHREAGVLVQTSAQVSGFEFEPQGDRISGVFCADGSRHEADLVVAGIGLLPNTELAQAAGLTVDDGIVVDELARTSDPDIVAAGDCTRHPSPLAGRSVRLESVPNALEQARTAAATLCGRERPHHLLPWFWSDQYDLKLKSVGWPEGYDTQVIRGSMGARAFSIFYLREGRVIATDSINKPQEFLLSKRLVAERAHVDVAALADETIALKDLLPAR